MRLKAGRYKSVRFARRKVRSSAPRTAKYDPVLRAPRRAGKNFATDRSAGRATHHCLVPFRADSQYPVLFGCAMLLFLNARCKTLRVRRSLGIDRASRHAAAVSNGSTPQRSRIPSMHITAPSQKLLARAMSPYVPGPDVLKMQSLFPYFRTPSDF